jgi:WD40 repeat protein/energy-coupling factor transporter ATP-binding protein EcfA2
MKRYALVIGIAEYSSSGLNNLEKPPVDAEAVARVLEQYGDFQEVKRLPENWSSRDRCEVGRTKLMGEVLTEALRNFLLEQAANSEALIYFSGHGIPVLDRLNDEQEGFLATSDCKIEFQGKRIISQQNGISLRSLNKLIDKSKVSSLVVILDCCHAGAFLEKDLVNRTLTAFNSAERDYYLMAACRRAEQAWEGEDYSIFTEALLKGLAEDKAGSEGQIICDQVFAVIDTELKGKGQEPIRMGLGRSITLVKYPKKAPVVFVPREECPYQGLKAFEEEQKQFFFGRQQVIDKIRYKLNQKAFVPIIGASGSGKSSVVRAGLIPLLKERESGWRVLKPIKPGIEPLTELRGAFKEFFQGAREKQLYAFIKNDPEGLVKLIERLPDSEQFLLVIDQFEEVFTVCPVEEDRRRFIELITQVAEIPDSRLAVVTTMRADFLEPCLQYESLTQLIQNQAIYMPPLMGGDLVKAIAKPAELQGYRLEDGLLGEILHDVKGAGSLPLLQFALTELWEKRDRENHLLTLEQYEVMEGAIGSLNRHAQKVYTYKDFWEDSPAEERTEQEQDWIKQIFLKLVRTGEEEKDTRQRQPRGKLLAIAGDNPEDREALNEVIDELVQGRLLVTGEAEQKSDIADSVQDAKMIDLAHEALMEGWTQFVEWRQENRELRRLSDRVEDAFREWQKDQKDENLMMGGLLAQVRLEWQNLEPDLEPNLKEFYQRSDAHERDRIAELQQALTESKLREQAARVLNLLPVQPLDGLVLAIQTMGLNLDKLPEGKILPPVQGSLNEAMNTARVSITFRGHENSVYSVAFSPDGKLIVSGSEDNTVRLWDIQGNPIGQPFQGHERSVSSVAFSPDGKLIVSGSEDNTVRLWDIQGNPIGQPFQGHERSVSSVAFSPDGKLIVSGSWDKTVRLWDIQGNPIGQPFQGHEASVSSVAFSPDGKLIVSGSGDNTVRLWDIQGNPIGQPFQGHESSVNSVAFSPDGKIIVSGSYDKTVRLWDISGNPIGKPFQGHVDSIRSVTFSRDGQMIASGSWDTTIRLWDLQGNLIGKPFRGHENSVSSIAFSPNGQSLVSGSYQRTVRLWYLQGSSIGQPFQGHEGSVSSVAFSPNGQSLVSGSDDKTLRLWDVQGKSHGNPFKGHENKVTSVAFSPDGQMIASGSWDGTVRLWDLQGNLISKPFEGHSNSVWSVAFSPDGQTLVSGSRDWTVRLWDVQGNPIGEPFQIGDQSVRSVAFNPNGQLIVSGSWDGTVRLWDLQGNPLGRPFQGHRSSVFSVAFSPDGQMIVSGGRDATVRLWDLQGNPIGKPFQGHEFPVSSVMFSPDGQCIVSGSEDKTVRLWNLQGNPIGEPLRGHKESVDSVAFSPDGKMIVSGSYDGTIRLWRGSWRAWLEVCCNRLRYHPVFQNPQTEVEKQACETCQKYVWSREES